MNPARLAVGLALALLACGGGGEGGLGGKYTSVENDALTMDFAGGKVTMTAAGMGTSSGTYAVEGEKIIVTVEGQAHTFIRDGDCIQDQLSVFGKLCKGGRSGEAGNVSTRTVPAAPTGTWAATSADGDFRIEFKPGNALTMTATPAGGGQADIAEGTFTVLGDEIHATVGNGVPLVLKYVNEGYESTSFGMPLTFKKQ
jgi:hypothetical protein